MAKTAAALLIALGVGAAAGPAGGRGAEADPVRRSLVVQAVEIERGDRVLGLGGTPTGTLSEFRRRMIEVRDMRSVLLSIGRGPYQYNLTVPLPKGSS